MFDWLKRLIPKRTRALSRGLPLGAASVDRFSGELPTWPETARQWIEQNHRTVVARSRAAAINDDFARSYLRKCTANIVGPAGVLLQGQVRRPRGADDEGANETIEAAWLEWSRPQNCDVSGRKSWAGVQEAAVRSAAINGEFLIRILTGSDAGPWGFALQFLDPQLLDPQHSTDDGGRIRHGIELNAMGRATAYYLPTSREYATTHFHGRDYLRVPAEEMIHGYLGELDDQWRGIPWLVSGLRKLHDLDGFSQAALINARVGAAKMGFIEWKEGTGPTEDDSNIHEIDAEPGTFPILPDGATLKEWNPQFPSGDLGNFAKSTLRGISAGAGVAYNSLAQDLEGVNFSSIRQGTIDERQHWMVLQRWLVETLHERVFAAWLPRALLSGRLDLPVENRGRYRVAWQPQRWTWIDPASEVTASVAEKNNLLISPGEIIRSHGRDPAQVWRETARDITRMREAGIPDEFIRASVLGNNLKAANNVKENQQEESAY